MTDDRRRIAANIPKYFIYTALKSFGFGLFIAIWVIFLTQVRGMTLAQAALVDSTFYVAVLFGEVPTGIVADRLGRKASITCGVILLIIGVIGWAFSPTLLLVMLSYVAMGIGITFTSGADDAFFFESIKLSGREEEYPRLLGRAGAVFPGAMAIGSVLGGLLASLDMMLPFLISSVVLVIALGVVLTFTEPKNGERPADHQHPSFGDILRQSLALMRSRPTLRYPMLYLALVPMASFMVEAVFLQPQALQLGVPIAVIGVIVMAGQLINMAGSALSERIKARTGEERLLYGAPVIIITSLILLAALQTLPALLFIAVMGFFTAVLRPMLMTRIQGQVPDEIRATVISMQSLLFTVAGILSQPTLGYVADQAGLPTAYFVLAGSLIVLVVLLLWASRQHFPRPVAYPADERFMEAESAA